MTDIQQWRRRIQPARARTPATDLNESETDLSPPTPRMPFRPLFTTQWPDRTDKSYPSKLPDHDWAARRPPSWVTDDPSSSPSIDELIDSLMCNLLGAPLNGLTGRFSNDLMRVFEGHRNLKDENESLQVRLEQESEKVRAMHLAWERERKDYKSEVKRLELILAKGKRGLAEVTLARQESVLERGQQARTADESGLETILEQLEKSKRHDQKTWSSQRAIMRRKSPSSKMRRLSRTLNTRAAKTTAYPYLPSGTPPSTSASILTPVVVEERAGSEPKTSMSDDDTFSTFSSIGDFLPDEVVEEPQNHTVRADAADWAFERRMESAAATRKPLTLKMKASGFLSKFKPQLTPDTSAGHRFSFEPGDDTNASLRASGLDNLPPGVKNRLLRKSASMSTLEARPSQPPAQERPWPPVVQSPMSSRDPERQHSPLACGDPARRSRIPTPVYRGSLSRPRSERDDSSSSLLTAIRQSDRASRRSNSLSSSAFGSPSGSRVDMTQGWHGLDVVQVSTTRTSGSNRLEDQTNALRGNGLATVVQAREFNAAMLPVDQQSADGLEPGTNGDISNYNRVAVQVDMGPNDGQLRKENGHPMRRRKRVNHENSVTQCIPGTPM